MSNDHRNGYDMPEELKALVEQGKARLPDAAKCCDRHALEALVERGARSMLGREPPAQDRRVGSITVRELLDALGQPDINAAREAIGRLKGEREAAAAEASEFHKHLSAVITAGQLLKARKLEELDEILPQLRALFASPPALTLLLYVVWVDENAKPVPVALSTPGAN